MENLLKPIPEFNIKETVGYSSPVAIATSSNQAELHGILKKIYGIGTYISKVYQVNVSNLEYIIKMLNYLEEFIYLNKSTGEIKQRSWNYISTDEPNPLITVLNNYTERTGILGHISIATSFGYFEQQLKNHNYEPVHLTALEELFTSEGKDIEVFTIPDKKYVLFESKTMPTLEDYARMKILQLSLYKSQIDGYKERATELYVAVKDNDNITLNKIIEETNKSELLITTVKRKINDLFAVDYDAKESQIISNIRDLRQQIESYNRAILEYIEKIKNKNRQLKLLKIQKEDNSTDFTVDYIYNHPYIVNISSVEENWISLQYEAPIKYYDEYAIDDIIESYEGEERFILETFLEGNYELMVNAGIRFNKETFEVQATRTATKDGFYPHPHIDAWGCFGNHDKAIFESAESGDYLGAIEQITQAVLNLNFYDPTVINQLLERLTDRYRYSEVWRDISTGAKYSTAELINIGKE